MRSGQFEIQESLEGGRLRLTLRGELDMSTSPDLEARLQELRTERRSVLMDLSQLGFMDSTGLAIMIRAINASNANGWAFVIDSDLSPQVRRLFSLAAVEQYATIDRKGTSSS